jgi:membrane fusion protein, multidrug efflux system
MIKPSAQPPRWRANQHAVALAVLAVLVGLVGGAVLVGCKRGGAKSKSDAASPELVPVRVETLARRPYQRVGRAVATVHPWRQVSIRAEAPGRVLDIRHEVGDKVKKDVLLVRLDGSVAWRSYKATRLGIKQGQVALRMARINLDRMKRLRSSGDIPQAQLDQAQNAFDRANTGVELAKAQTAQVGRQLGNYWVRAPFAGVLAKRPINVGDYVSPGSPVFTVVEMKRVKVVVGLDPTEGLLLKKGMPAKVSVKTIRGSMSRPAKVYLVRPLADATTRRVEIELVVDNQDLLLKPGVVAQVEIPLAAPESRLLVPADAVVALLGRRYVYVLRDGKARRVEVKLGVSTADRVEILPRGVLPAKVGEPLVVQGVQRLVPGARVKIVPSRPPSLSRGPVPMRPAAK